jgi:hypothetical protein
LESHYLELRRRYEELLVVVRKIRSEAVDGEGRWCGMQDSEKNNAVVTSSEFEIMLNGRIVISFDRFV